MGHPLISIDANVMRGKPCIKGTRITVELVLRKMGSGRTIEDLLSAYPDLNEDQILAALRYAADHLSTDTVIAAE